MESSIDHQFFQRGYQYICGIDEAGRGPWAGPVYIAAVILPQKHNIEGLDDSKKLSVNTREKLFQKITRCAIAYSIVSVSHLRIDKRDILSATKQGMQKAVQKLPLSPDLLLLDALNINLPEILQVNLVRGDSRSESIAAASILAKVSRDRYMIQMHDKYPVYNFRNNKGYGTAEHHEALQQYGPCPLHRMSFEPMRSNCQK
jgi:ribonuclease HII